MKLNTARREAEEEKRELMKQLQIERTRKQTVVAKKMDAVL